MGALAAAQPAVPTLLPILPFLGASKRAARVRPGLTIVSGKEASLFFEITPGYSGSFRFLTNRRKFSSSIWNFSCAY
jgi:hypothetical protein